MEAASRFGVVLERDEGRSGNGFIVRANIMVSTATIILVMLAAALMVAAIIYGEGAPILTGALSF